MPAVRYATVLFDLDGTILETAEGVLNGFCYALERLGRPFPDHVDSRRFIGPPLRYSFREWCGVCEEDMDRAIMLHREYYGSRGLFEAKPYPGVIELMRDLHKDGARVCVATSKYRGMAEKVLDHFGIRPYLSFAAMSGGGEQVSAKSDIIREALAHCGVAASAAVMVGDTVYDAEGAREVGIPFVGVLFGYGTRAEMEQEGASRFAADAQELRAMLY